MVLFWYGGFAVSYTEVCPGGGNIPGGFIHMGSDITEDQAEFGRLVQEYKHRTGYALPPCDVLLEIVAEMGYSRNPPMTPRDLSQLVAKETYRARCVKKRRGYFLTCSETLAIIIGQGYAKSSAVHP